MLPRLRSSRCVPHRRARTARAWLAVPLLAGVVACGGGDDAVEQTGSFGPIPVAGLDVSGSQSGAQQTDARGSFRMQSGERLQFAIGGIVLGTATAPGPINALTVTPEASASSDRRVTNKLVLLQALDADGSPNNGIQIGPAVRDAAAARPAPLNFDQEPAAFRAALAPLLAAVEAAGGFNDADPRPRSAPSAVAALELFQRASSRRHEVTVTTGTLRGHESSEGTWQFLGIPYAKPPVGELRWRPPQAPEAWTGVRDAVAWGDQAAQNPALERFGEGGMSEDSLYLNVTTPKTAAKLPVMVWFHGGGFTSLTSNTKAFNNPAGPVTKDVVQVSVNHRLGPFGYMAHPALSQESGYGGSGNYGQMDLIMALNWVKQNIASFGGDPDNVTIYGESGGGRKVLSLMASPRAAGLFHRAISQSGTLIPDTRSLAAAEAIGTTLATNLGATTLAEMRARPWTEIAAAAAALVPYTNVDKHYLPDTERASFESRRHNDVPFMMVVNTNDTPDPIATVKNVLPWMTTHSAQPHYAALFSHVPAGWRAQGLKTYHGGELTYVFNAPESVVAHFQLNLVIDPATNTRLVVGDLNGNGVTGSAGDSADVLASAGFDATDATVADTTMTLWTSFARTGKPSAASLADWPVYTPATDAYVELGATPVPRTGLSTVFP